MKLEGEPEESNMPTPGEKLLCTLGNLYWLWLTDPESAVPPNQLDIEAVARSLEIWGDVEFIQDGENDDRVDEQYIHFASEVMLIDHAQDFPWQLFDVWAWAREQEVKDFWRYLD